jgi:hypothetical protein
MKVREYRVNGSSFIEKRVYFIMYIDMFIYTVSIFLPV